MWDPDRYLEFSEERGRPFADLLSRVGARRPRIIVDLGCGPGQLTAMLAARWPEAIVTGIDSSVEMIARAQATAAIPGRVEFRLGDLRDWQPAEPVDVLVTNATLQWVPGHRDVLRQLVAAIRPGGWLAFQVPGNFDGPSHRILRDLAAEPRWGIVGRVRFPFAHELVEYVDVLAGLGCRVDAWETTYLHILKGTDPVFRWISGTGARPVLAALPAGRREAFADVFKERLRVAYPPRPYGTLLPFRRILVVARTKET